MKNQLITEIETAMLPFLDNAQLKQLHDALNHASLSELPKAESRSLWIFCRR